MHFCAVFSVFSLNTVNKNPCIPLRDYDVEKKGQMVAHTALIDGTSECTSGGALGGEEPTLESSLGQS